MREQLLHAVVFSGTESAKDHHGTDSTEASKSRDIASQMHSLKTCCTRLRLLGMPGTPLATAKLTTAQERSKGRHFHHVLANP